MAITTGSVITYQDLVNLVLSTIKSRCQNIGNINSISGYLKSGASASRTSSVTTTGTSDGKGTGFTPSTVTTRARASLSSTPVTVVTEQTITDQFNAFMSERGIANKANTVMTLRGILNFLANAAAFIKTKVVVVGNDYNADTAVVYVANNTSFPSITSDTSNITQDAFLTTNLNEMIAALNNTQGYYQCYYNFSVSCCSSSSSSCSSSCSSSSSSSSSSSFFIGYMKL